MSFSAFVLIYQFFFYFSIHMLAMSFYYNFCLIPALPYSSLILSVCLRIYIYMNLNDLRKARACTCPTPVIDILLLTESDWLTPHFSPVSEISVGLRAVHLRWLKYTSSTSSTPRSVWALIANVLICIYLGICYCIFLVMLHKPQAGSSFRCNIYIFVIDLVLKSV